MEDKKAAMKEWVENWKRVGPLLEELQRIELGRRDTDKEGPLLINAFEIMNKLEKLRDHQ